MPRTAAVCNRLALALAVVLACGLLACGGGNRFNLSRGISGVTRNGSVEVRSTPDGARVYVDSHYKGTTPHRMNLNEGTHLVVVKKPGYKDAEVWPQIKPGKTEVLDLQLEAE